MYPFFLGGGGDFGGRAFLGLWLGCFGPELRGFWLEGFLVVVPGVDWSRAQGVCDLEGEGSLS